MKATILQISILIITAVILFVVFWKDSDTKEYKIIPQDFKKSEVPFVNPTVVSDIGKHYIINFKPLRDVFYEIKNKYPHKSYIYFLYLNNGAWVGIDEREEFTAASTIKVPLAMSLLKSVSDKKINISDTYSLEELNLDYNFGELYKVGAGKEFSLEELLKIMLEESDNTAMNGIVEALKLVGIEDPLSDVYNDLGWEFAQNIPEMGQTPDYSKINLKTLSNMFLALYNAKYLDVYDSNKILYYLANTPFVEKIDAGVPESVVVSHKIGTSVYDRTFSDCGIVYAPNRHYLLCIGSNGGDEKAAAEFMAQISAEAYKYVINN